MDRFAGISRYKLLGAAAIAVLVAAALGLPAYNDRARHAEIHEAFRNLSDIGTWMEGYYQHYRNYAKGDVCGAAVVPEERARHFTYTCALNTTAGAASGQSYKITAKGKSRHTTGFIFTIDQSKARATLSIPADWGPLPANARATWVDRKP